MKKIKFLLFATGVLSATSMPLIASQCSAKEQKSEEPKTPTNYENAFVLQPAGTFENVNAKIQEKANQIRRYSLLKRYGSFNGIGIFGGMFGSEGNDNKILLPKEGIAIDQILSTMDAKDNVYFDGTWNPETKILTIKYKIKDNGDKVYEQSFTLS
ncbi:hypothetical protein [Mycoplasma sp. 21DD0573]|uniref:hypothetical protein n=1 Tax=unclassified Mycoplasma TaxID=2683645 RepID=UPI002B1DB121|nr:hypothetical protein [Mycoplasma sp. 21DD0573]MEA4276125.1 hypothetical protein [Mycoplasma sp. 21DD0573]